jgi:lipopolysaccharide transport system ATP-binding protein
LNVYTWDFIEAIATKEHLAMKTQVQFEHVYTQYHLGLTRASLPALVSGWLKQSLRPASRRASQEKAFWALDDVSFELKEGESLALVGANGAGKTTILKLLSNITKPTSGSIRTSGQLSALIELGAGFHPDLTGRENIYLNGAILGLSPRMVASRFDEIVAFSELERFIDTPVKRYSSGMTVRLGFAVASCIEPEILLVDEVLAVGDAAFQQKCMRRIRSLLNRGTSIIFVSHNLYLVQAICSRSLYLEKGKVQYLGDTKEAIDLYEQALHRARAQRFEDGHRAHDADESTDIEITSVEVLGAHGAYAETLLNHEPAQVRIHYNAYRPLGAVHASVFIMRSDGTTCCMVRTKLANVELMVDRGQGVVSVFLEPLQLVSGSYFAEAWFLNSNDSMAITPKGGRSDWFTVKGSAMSYTNDSGVFEPNSRWSHQPDQLPAPNGNVMKDSRPAAYNGKRPVESKSTN